MMMEGFERSQVEWQGKVKNKKMLLMSNVWLLLYKHVHRRKEQFFFISIEVYITQLIQSFLIIIYYLTYHTLFVFTTTLASSKFSLTKIHFWMLTHKFFHNILFFHFVTRWFAHSFLSLIKHHFFHGLSCISI